MVRAENNLKQKEGKVKFVLFLSFFFFYFILLLYNVSIEGFDSIFFCLIWCFFFFIYFLEISGLLRTDIFIRNPCD